MRRRNGVKKSNKDENLPKKNQEAKSSIGSTLLGNLAVGASFGAGSSLGHRAIDAIIGSNNKNNEVDNTQSIKYNDNSCEKLLELYNNCLINQQNNCDFLQEFIIKKCNK